MSDDAFHEIQLSGKQVVFLFMATTVVSVVIFLCGVLVGRGVRAQQGPAMGMLAVAGGAQNDSEAASGMVDPTLEDGATETVDDAAELSYYERLEGETVPIETLRPLAEAVVDDDGVDNPAPAPPPDPEVPTPSTATAPSADGFTVQVAALRGRDDAEAIREQLSSKGYPAYVLDPAPDAPAAVYRVRVGRYQDRSEAESIRRRLEEEEQFKPWITR